MFKSVKTKRIFEEISDQIKELIFSGVLKTGDKLPSERELARQFNAGRMVVREALLVLEQSGFIQIKQGSEGGSFVKGFDSTVVTRSISDLIRLKNLKLEELTEVRLCIEKAILEIVIERIDDNDKSLLKRNIEDTDQLILQGLRPRENNVRFHLLLARSTKNPLFGMIIQSIMDAVYFYLIRLTPDMDYIKKVLNYHKEIYDAIEEKDLKTAREKLEEHILDVNTMLSGLDTGSKEKSRMAATDIKMEIGG